jgi:hypothetical protein
MLSGVYRVHFDGPLEAGKGIMYAKDGKIVGGDSEYVYGGTLILSVIESLRQFALLVTSRLQQGSLDT